MESADGKIRVLVTFDPKHPKLVSITELRHNGFYMVRPNPTEDQIPFGEIENWISLSFYGDDA